MKASPQTAKGTMRALRPILAAIIPRLLAIETYGAVFPNQLIEAVADPKAPDNFACRPGTGTAPKRNHGFPIRARRTLQGRLKPVSLKLCGFHRRVGRSDRSRVWFHPCTMRFAGTRIPCRRTLAY